LVKTATVCSLPERSQSEYTESDCDEFGADDAASFDELGVS
jgi:hypothetical protein